MSTSLLLLLGCKPEPPPIAVFQPSAVGFGFDGALTTNGSLTGYAIGPDTYDAVMVLQFVSDAFFEATDDVGRASESCIAIAGFEQSPLVKPDQIPTFDDSPLSASYETSLVLSNSSCGLDPLSDGDGKADPELWGEHGQDLTDPFDGAHFGYGLAPMTDTLRESWTSDTLNEIGPSMLSSWIAINDVDGAWVASDWTTAIAFDWDPAAGQLLTQVDTNGELQLVPLVVDTLTIEDPLPPMYVQSYPNWFQDFSLIDFTNLGD